MQRHSPLHPISLPTVPSSVPRSRLCSTSAFTHRLREPAHVANCIQCPQRHIAWTCIFFTSHGRHMVRSYGSFKADIVIRFHGLVHIDLAFIVESFCKFGAGQLAAQVLNVSEMNKIDLAFFTPSSNQGGNIDAH